ncbi:MAG: hypothetical protein SWZ49_04385, partial [Cyanobacteriota bacterium]|nr:hypothetical protein [Cyanobacteriota bacterium]
LHKQNPPARVVNSLVHGGGETSLGCRFPSPKLANPKGLCLYSSGFNRRILLKHPPTPNFHKTNKNP